MRVRAHTCVSSGMVNVLVVVDVEGGAVQSVLGLDVSKMCVALVPKGLFCSWAALLRTQSGGLQDV